MSLIHLEKQGDHWCSRVEGHFILGAHPIEAVRKGLPEAMAQAVVDHCAMSGEDIAAFSGRLMGEIAALAPSPSPPGILADIQAAIDPQRAYEWQIAVGSPAEPRRARIPRR